MLISNIQEATIASSSLDEDVIAWAHARTDLIRKKLHDHGRLLIRGFRATPGAAQTVLSLLTNELMEDVFWSTPRKRVTGKTFTATHYPAQREIRMHNEMAYSSVYPRLLCFHAVKTAEQGGATPIADLDAVSRSIADIVEQFAKRGVLYVRTFRPGIDIPFADAFGKQTQDEAVDEAKSRGMTVEMLANGNIKIMVSGRGTLSNLGGMPLWFNQMHLFHPASLSEEDRNNMVQVFGEEGLPRNATFGDGNPIPDAITRRVNSALEEHAEDMNWQCGDILLLDNLRYMHGRRSFSGERIVHVSMGRPTEGDVRLPFAE